MLYRYKKNILGLKMRKLIILFSFLVTEKVFSQVQNGTDYIQRLKSYINSLLLGGYDWIIITSIALLIIFWILYKDKKLFYKISLGYYLFIILIQLSVFVLNYSAIVDMVNIGHFGLELIPEIYAVSTTTSLLFMLYSLIYFIILLKRK